VEGKPGREDEGGKEGGGERAKERRGKWRKRKTTVLHGDN
jgi:hypothetical protein